MEKDEVTEMLLSRFDPVVPRTGLISRVVVWRDQTGEFRDSIDNMDLKDIRLLKWDGYNGFQIKCMVEHDDPDSRFLIYMPGDISTDEDNIIADIIHYSKPIFTADKSSCLANEIGLTDSNVDIVRQYSRFFNNAERRKRFQRLVLNKDDESSIVSAMIAVALNAESSETLDLIISIIMRFSDSPGVESEDEIMSLMDKYDLADRFWHICNMEFGYSGESISDLIRSIFITASTLSTDVAASPKLAKYILPKGYQVSLMVDRLLKDSTISEEIDTILDWIVEKVNLTSVYEAFDISIIADTRVFPCSDRMIIDRSVKQICSTFSPIDDTTSSIVIKRYGLCRDPHLKSEYGMLIAASDLICECQEFKNAPLNDMSPTEIIRKYVDSWNSIDTHYRHFMRCADRSDSDHNESLMKLVEDTYVNVFLEPVIRALCDKVTSYNDLPGPSLTSFCKKHISSDRVTVVIISDAFRYECAKELNDRLKKTSKIRDSNLSHMISTIPSITSFGMAALLPNEGLQISHDGNYNVLINGEYTESTNREVILKGTYPDSIVIKYSHIKEHGKETRERCKGKRLIYVYHDAIDAIGDDFKTESKVFEACESAIDEIEYMIRTITNWSYTKFIITADHGFLYRRSSVKDYDKISTVDGFQSSRRYALNDRSFGLEQTVEFSLDYLSDDNADLFVSIPDSLGVFKLQGGGMNYVHGGLSPQEIVVPVLTVNTVKGAVSEKYVGLKSSGKTSVKQRSPRFRLLQENAVSNEFREAEYELWLVDKDNQRISASEFITANSDDPSDLEHAVTFRTELKSKVVKLVIKNMTDPDEDSKEIEYTVNMLYNDFI